MEMSCSLDGGLWPLAWAALIICVTVYNVKAMKGKGDQ